jgi:hypothetical protein
VVEKAVGQPAVQEPLHCLEQSGARKTAARWLQRPLRGQAHWMDTTLTHLLPTVTGAGSQTSREPHARHVALEHSTGACDTSAHTQTTTIIRPHSEPQDQLLLRNCHSTGTRNLRNSTNTSQGAPGNTGDVAHYSTTTVQTCSNALRLRRQSGATQQTRHK